MEILQEKENKLLHRKEILLKTNFEKSTPSKEEITKQLVNKLKVDPEVLKLDKVKQKFGERSADITAYVYKDKESLKQVEVKNKKVKKEAKKTEEQK